jgi:hypothetical protein
MKLLAHQESTIHMTPQRTLSITKRTNTIQNQEPDFLSSLTLVSFRLQPPSR